MLHFNDNLVELQQKAAGKKRAETLLADLCFQKTKLEQKASELEKIKLDEQKDVDRLEGRSLSAFFYGVFGTKEEILDKEKKEAYAARVKYDAAVQELEAVTYEITKYENEVRQLQGCEERYENLLKEKTEAVKTSSTTYALDILKLEEQISDIENQKVEIQEAVREGMNALSIARSVQQSLKEAGDCATWDMFGGGLLADLAKHDALDQAQGKVEKLQLQLRRYKTELSDVTIHADIKVNIEGFLQFADFFFDGLFIDWEVRDQINRSKSQIENTINQINQVQSKLNSMIEHAEEEQGKLQKEIEDIVVRA